MNDPEKKKCEICGEDLNTKPPISLSSLSLSGKNDNKDIVKLSFRSGGNAKFLEELEAALAAKAWEVKARETVDSRPTASTGICEWICCYIELKGNRTLTYFKIQRD